MGGRVSIFSATSLGGTLSVCGSLVTDVSEETSASSLWVLAIRAEQARMNKNYIEICKYIEITLHGCRLKGSVWLQQNKQFAGKATHRMSSPDAFGKPLSFLLGSFWFLETS